jgi:hypothetical protein
MVAAITAITAITAIFAVTVAVTLAKQIALSAESPIHFAGALSCRY